MEKKDKKKEFWRAFKFTLISASAGIVQILSFTLLNELFKYFNVTVPPLVIFGIELGEDYGLAYLPSLILSIIWNFTINRKVTFKSANNVTIAMLLVLAFYVVFTPVSVLLGEWAKQSFNANEYLILAVTMLLNFVLEYLFTRFVVYRKSCDTKPDKNGEENAEKKAESENKDDKQVDEQEEKN